MVEVSATLVGCEARESGRKKKKRDDDLELYLIGKWLGYRSYSLSFPYRHKLQEPLCSLNRKTKRGIGECTAL